MSLSAFLDALKSDQALASAFAHEELLPRRRAVHGQPERPLPPPLQAGLEAVGVSALYSHQAEALDAIRRGENLVAATPTASGKSLMYNLPVLETLNAEADSNALYMFPLKALEQDQLTKLQALIDRSGWSRLTAAIYDGDTPDSRRAKIRKCPPRILITNPDMLNLAILGYHANWEDFLRGLRFIVLDELHIYRGVFGSHFLHLLRRLIRLCRFYGANPQIIATSATIADARQLAEALSGQPFTEITTTGAPANQRHFLFFNPQTSYLSFTLDLFTAALKAGLKTIVFTNSRRSTELLHMWLNRSHPQWGKKVSSYRAGFLPEERREIEDALMRDRLQGVISTSALELGIDVGGLDVCILAGYPGTVSATWQRAGRVGRGDDPAAVCLVAGQNQLDQFFMKHPADFFARPVEKAIVDSDNEFIVRPHLICAAQEIPITAADAFWNTPFHKGLLDALVSEGELLLGASGDRYFSSRRRPQLVINLRSAGDQYAIEVEGSYNSLGSISGRAVFAECHPGAVYLHRGTQFLVTGLDREARKVSVKEVEVNYYTMPLFEKETTILAELQARELPAGKVTLARLKVTEQLVGFQTRRMSTQDLISQQELDFPPTSFETIGLAIAIPAATAPAAAEAGLHFRGGIHGVEHALLALAPLFAMCDRSDMGGYSQTEHPQVGGPCVFLYDGYPGGIGLTARLYEVFPELASKTLSLVAQCECEVGCPSCIHSPKCGHGNVPLDKGGAILTLEVLTGARILSTKEETAASEGATPGMIISEQFIKEEKPVKPMKIVPTPTAWPEGKTGLVFDVETQRSADEVGGWGNVKAMGLAWASAYRLPDGKWFDFAEADVDKLVELLRSVDVVIGFNQIRFDYEVLRGYSGFDFRKLKSFDMLAEIYKLLGYRLSLGSLAAATLGAGKTADGLQSLAWWKEGRLDLIAEYCRADVEITRDLFFHALEKGYLLFEKRGIGLVQAPIRFRMGD